MFIKKILISTTILLSFSNLYAVESKAIPIHKQSVEEKAKINAILDTKITGNSSTTIIQSIEKNIQPLSDVSKIKEALEVFINRITMEETYNILKSHNNFEDMKDLKKMIIRSVEIKSVEKLNDLTIRELLSLKNENKVKYDYYKNEYTKLIQQREENRILNYYFGSFTDSDFDRELKSLLESIHNIELRDTIAKSIKTIIKANEKNNEEKYSLFLSKNVKQIIKEAYKINPQIIENIKK